MNQCQVSEYDFDRQKIGEQCENEGYKKFKGIWLCHEHYRAYLRAITKSVIEED